MKKIKIVTLIILCFLGMTGCKKADEKIEISSQVIKIPVSFIVNPDTGQNENEGLVKAFNEAYEGKYQLEVEWVTESPDGYRSRIKMLNGLDKMPAIITDAGFDDDFYRLLVEEGRLVDLYPYMEEDKSWMNVMEESVMKRCQEKDGRMFLAPIGVSTHSYCGFFYNKEIFKAAGIETFPTTWEDFWDCLDILKDYGVTPLSLHGGSSYWNALLISTNYMARTNQGMEFLNTQYPTSYNNESFVDMISMMERMYSYADSDAVEIERPEAVLRFQNQTNVITANGGWMITTLPYDVKMRTGFAPFPGNIMMKDSKMTAWAVTSGYDQEVIDGAVAFIKFRAIRNDQEAKNFLNHSPSSVVEKEYRDAVLQANEVTPNYQLMWESYIQNDFFINYFPTLQNGKMTEDEFISLMDQSVEEVNSEK